MSIDFGGGSRFVVDVGQLDALINGLMEARDAIVKINADVKWTRQMAIPPSQDPYSPDGMEKIIERTLDMAPGTHSSANLAYRAAVQSMLDKLIAAKKQYASAEGVNRSIIKREG
ncbi:hypothetical protein N8J89_05320 [Crossiella sp. CA-258035]|uniref:hypothetical protein n=1 Tax=Crossiella sp. CA-258035 TaxID=2981138 RepID=UPI0024BC6ADD|nr:hypothetical protein [Crossiella sp. CA-258035]WHT20490.1 hypothetical protein N8J89_05320 [Crossiella sp. CA-258035]